MKSKVIAALIALFIILVPFRIAFIDVSLDSQLLNTALMIVTILGSMSAAYIGTFEIFDNRRPDLD